MQLSPRRALVWSFAERYASFVVGIGSTLVLARLLTPAQVGVYSVCAALSAVAGILRDFGVSEFLIQERELTRDKIRAAFGIALLVAWPLAAAIFLGRNAAAAFFREPGVAEVLAVLSLHYVILPLSSPAFALLNRELAFRKIFALQIACNTAHAATSVTLAWRGCGTLSLAWGPVAGVALQTLLLAWMRPRESFVLPGVRQARVVLRFGAAYMGSRLIETMAQNFHETVIARVYGFTALGLFSRALGLIEMFRSNVTDAIVRVATPVFAAGHRAGRPLNEALARATAIFVSVAWPFLGFVALTSAEIIRVMFGPQWEPAAPLASILALAAFPACLYELVPQMLSATGHVRKRLRLALWVSPSHMALVLLAGFVSLQWTAAAFGASSLLMLILSLRELRLALGDGRAALWRPCLGSAGLALGSIAAQVSAVAAARSLSLPAPVVLLTGMGAGLLAWWLVGRATRHPSYLEAVGLRVAWLRASSQRGR